MSEEVITTYRETGLTPLDQLTPDSSSLDYLATYAYAQGWTAGGGIVMRQEPTKFADTNALLAVMVGDYNHARTILDGFLAGELVSLQQTCDKLIDLIQETLDRKVE